MTAVATMADSAKRARRRVAHPLLGPFPVAVMTLGTFLVVFALLMGRLANTGTPALAGAGATPALVAGSSGSRAITTSASGGGAAGATAPGPSAANQTKAPAGTSTIVTRASGALAATESGGDA